MENSTFHELLMFWVREARISSFYYTRILQKIQENQGTSLGKLGKYVSKKSETQEFRNFGNLRCPLFEFLKFRIPDFLIIRNDEFLKFMKSRRRGISWD